MLGRNARGYVEREHSLEGAARGYVDFLARLHGWDPLPPLRPPLWTVEEPQPAISLASRSLPPSPGPAPNAPTDPAVTQLAAGAGAALAELVLTPRDAALDDVASIVAGMFGPHETGQK